MLSLQLSITVFHSNQYFQLVFNQLAKHSRTKSSLRSQTYSWNEDRLKLFRFIEKMGIFLQTCQIFISKQFQFLSQLNNVEKNDVFSLFETSVEETVTFVYIIMIMMFHCTSVLCTIKQEIGPYILYQNTESPCVARYRANWINS